jgi:hypothetical protein
MSRLLLLAALVTMAFTACDSSDSKPAADAGSEAATSSSTGHEETGDKDGRTIVCHCPGSCGIPDQDVEWPADRECGNGACDGISNCVASDAGDGG